MLQHLACLLLYPNKNSLMALYFFTMIILYMLIFDMSSNLLVGLMRQLGGIEHLQRSDLL